MCKISLISVGIIQSNITLHNMMIILPSMDLSDMYTTMGIILSMYEEHLSTRITLDYNAQALDCS
jgi:hypothetical protein